MHYSGYEVLEVVQKSEAEIYRCLENNRTIILKATPETVSGEQLKKEFNIGRIVCERTESVVVYERLFENYDAEKLSVFIVMEDGGQDLLSLLPSTGFTVKKVLKIAIQCSQALAAIHKHGIIHCDIKPSNIVYNKKTKKIKLIDFSSALRFSQKVSTFPIKFSKNAGLSHISPEQTGRLDRVVDYRTDFYSLGVTIYQLLSGKKPFISDDVMELIHSHVAVEPPPLPRHIPTVLCEIVAKLMSKDADDRYVSITGLLHDLNMCQTNLTNGCIEYFPIATHDFMAKFVIPKKLYGREEESKTLLETFERVSTRGKGELLLVSGYSGIGKSSLIAQIRTPITMRNGYYITGKFDQVSKNISYSAIADAFQSLLRQILGESEERVQMWRERILKSVGLNGSLIIKMIPEVEKLIGEQPPVSMNPQESASRFKLVLQSFVSTFMQKDHPLVLFLDDLQWADRESIELVSSLLDGSEVQYMLIIGAYRSNEVSSSHPLQLAINELTKANSVPISNIELRPLPFNIVKQWIVDLLNNISSASSRDVAPLAEIIFKKTEGNPFFVKVFMQMLYDEKLLTISTDGTQWEWNISSILKQKATDNVIDLMVQCINQLSEDAQNILKWISCLGNSVPLWKIELLLNIQRQELFSALIPAIEAGMAHIVDDCFQFAHDRVQEAVDSKILRKEKQSMHFKIGSILLKHINNIQDKFEVTDHLNKGVMESDIELSDEQLLEIMDLNLTVGTRAYQSVAFSFACNYSKCGVWYFSKQLYKSEDEAWRKQYTLGMSLYKLLANSYFVLNEYDHMSETIDLILKKSQNIVDTTEGYNLLVTYYTNIGDFQKAMEYGRAALELHNIIIPNDSGTLKNDLQAEKKKIVDRMDELRTSCGEIDITSLLIPPTPEQFVLLSLISTLGGTAYLAQSESFPLIMAKQVYNSLRHCITSESAIAFAFYTCDLISNEEYSSANEFSQLSVIVAEKYFPSKLNDRVKALHLYCVFAQHWFKTIRLTTSRSREIFKLAIGCGEIPYAGFSYTALCPAFLYTGYNILESLAEMDKCLEFSIKTKNQTAIGCVQSASLVLNRLSMQDAEEYAQLAVKLAPSSADVFNNTHYRVYSLMVDYMMDEEKYDDLSSYVTKQFKNIEELQEVTKCVKGLFAVVLFNVYSTLTTIRLMGLLGETKHELSARMLSFVESSMTQLKYWVDVCYKDNFLNKYLMISAELKSVQGDIWSAVNLYDESIAAAKENEFTHECALANELAAKCMIKGGKPQFAQVYLNSAFETYEQWGAYRKLDLLSDKYNGMISRINYSGFGKSSTTGKNKHRVNSLSSSLDIEGILRVSQTISSTIDMSELLVKIMKVIVETAGATSAAIIIDNQVEAEYYSQNITTSSIPLQSWKRGCVAVVEYVTRTRENIVLADASSDKKYGFGSNSYVMQSRAKSILCMPVTHQNELKAVLYCENSKINDCFTMDRITVLNILTNQIAISLENSKYFKIQLKAVQDLAEIQSQRASEEKTYRKKQEEFVDRICHEIRNPIQGIQGNCHLLRQDVSDMSKQNSNLDWDALQQYIDGIDICSRYQKVITDDVLTLKFGQVKLNLEPLLPAQIVQTVLQMFSSEAIKKKLELKAEIEDENLIIIGDSTRISQVLINLVSNAVKFTSQGRITISIRCEEQKDKLNVTFAVEDTGVGIEMTAQLFNRFEQIPQRTFSDYEGSGLGLFISKHLVEIMGGTIGVKSEKDKGACFTFNILSEKPTNMQINSVKTKNTIHRRVVTPEEVFQNHHVLVCEDNRINQRILVQLVTKAGGTCVAANDGVEGVELFSSDPNITLVFMDVSMPRMDGFEATKKIREIESQSRSKQVAIIGISGNVRQEYYEKGLETGMNDYLYKPITLDDIVRVMQSF